MEDHDRIDLLPEKKRYEPGETAIFQVRMPFREATALVTVEREGVMEAWVQKISGKKPVVEVPIKGILRPQCLRLRPSGAGTRGGHKTHGPGGPRQTCV